MELPIHIVIKKIGKPLRVKEDGYDECGGGFLKILYYDGFEIKFLNDERKRNYAVTSMKLTPPKWIIASSIKIGTNIKNVRSQFGQPNPNEESSEETLDYVTKENLGLVTFYFHKNKLVKVEMVETLC